MLKKLTKILDEILLGWSKKSHRTLPAILVTASVLLFFTGFSWGRAVDLGEMIRLIERQSDSITEYKSTIAVCKQTIDEIEPKIQAIFEATKETLCE